MRIFKCPICNIQIKTKNGTKRYCGPKCSLKSRDANGARFDCGICGGTFTREASKVRLAKKLGRTMVCSRDCQTRLFSQRGAGKRRSRNYRSESRTWMYLREDTRNERGAKCQICEWDRYAPDLCHIIDKANGGDMTGENVVLLCQNHHRLFDHGLLLPEEIETLWLSMKSFEYKITKKSLKKGDHQ